MPFFRQNLNFENPQRALNFVDRICKQKHSILQQKMSKSEEFSRKFQELYPERDGKVSETKKSDFLTGQSNRVTIIREKNCYIE